MFFPRFKKIDISRDVIFDEDLDYKKSRKRPVEDLEEKEVPSIQDTTMNETTPEEDREMEEPQELIDPPHEKNSYKRKPTWVREAIQGAERYGAPQEMHRERKRTRSYSSCVALPYDEATKNEELKDVMIEEYQSIMKNDVWDVVLRPKGKFVVASKWIYKIKHAADGDKRNINQYLWLMDSPRKK